MQSNTENQTSKSFPLTLKKHWWNIKSSNHGTFKEGVKRISVEFGVANLFRIDLQN